MALIAVHPRVCGEQGASKRWTKMELLILANHQPQVTVQTRHQFAILKHAIDIQ